MSFEHGTLVKWNDERGFGFIKPDAENVQVFVHIKTFGPIARRPLEGDRVYFDSSIGEKGTRKATVARITESSATQAPHPRRGTPTTRSPAPGGWSSRPGNTGYSRPPSLRRRIRPYVAAVLLPIAGIAYLASRCSSPVAPSPVQTFQEQQVPTTVFRCEGKKRCGEMSTKEEAQFYLNNCPGVMIDGDGDGDACEDQFGK